MSTTNVLCFRLHEEESDHRVCLSEEIKLNLKWSDSSWKKKIKITPSKFPTHNRRVGKTTWSQKRSGIKALSNFYKPTEVNPRKCCSTSLTTGTSGECSSKSTQKDPGRQWRTSLQNTDRRVFTESQQTGIRNTGQQGAEGLSCLACFPKVLSHRQTRTHEGWAHTTHRTVRENK